MNKSAIVQLFTLVAFIILAFNYFTISDAVENTLIKMETSEGNVYLELYDDKAPLSVANFLAYTNEGFYNGTIFHRVISNYVIQGGGFTESMEEKLTKSPIRNEANNGLKNLKGTIAMARFPDPHTATAQFFINVQDNPKLNHTGEQNNKSWGYAVFGQVVQGMDVINEIKLTTTTGKMPFSKDVPMKNIVIKSVTVIDQLPESK
jgi:peptidyl-prolyl cis-trans isomerase B (cyclophilin B)